MGNKSKHLCKFNSLYLSITLRNQAWLAFWRKKHQPYSNYMLLYWSWHKIPNAILLKLIKLILHGFDPVYILQGFFNILRGDSRSVAHVIKRFLNLTLILCIFLTITNDVINGLGSLCPFREKRTLHFIFSYLRRLDQCHFIHNCP